MSWTQCCCREVADNSKAQAQSDGTSLADKPEIILERLGFARPRQQQLVSMPLSPPSFPSGSCCSIATVYRILAAACLLLHLLLLHTATLLLHLCYCIFADASPCMLAGCCMLHFCHCIIATAPTMLHYCYCKLHLCYCQLILLNTSFSRRELAEIFSFGR